MAGEEYSETHRAEEEKMLIKINSGPQKVHTLKMVGVLYFPKSPGLSGGIERLGHPLSKPFQFSLV